METIKFNIKRFDGQKKWTQTYEFPREVTTLLSCLTKIKEEQDDSLCFTSACRHSICGSCAIQVNGSAFLACETQLDDLISTYETTEFTLEPLNHFPVVRDLVVSFDEKAEQMKKIEPWMCQHKRPPRPFAVRSRFPQVCHGNRLRAVRRVRFRVPRAGLRRRQLSGSVHAEQGLSLRARFA